MLLLEGWARDGLTDEQIAKNIGIGVRTLYEWRNKYPPILQTLKKSKDIVDREVENALFKRATGYDCTEETKERQYNKETGKFELIVTKTVRKHIPPETAAAIFWLKNRRPEQWREKRQEIASGNDDGVEIINDAPG